MPAHTLRHMLTYTLKLRTFEQTLQQSRTHTSRTLACAFLHTGQYTSLQTRAHTKARKWAYTHAHTLTQRLAHRHAKAWRPIPRLTQTVHQQNIRLGAGLSTTANTQSRASTRTHASQSASTSAHARPPKRIRTSVRSRAHANARMYA
eukprot:6213882-Pleurochrysis_carterae.AAC.3